MNHRLAALFGISLATCIATAGCGTSSYIAEPEPLPTGEEVAAEVSADAEQSYKADPEAVLYASSLKPDPQAPQDAESGQTKSEAGNAKPGIQTKILLMISEESGNLKIHDTHPGEPVENAGVDLSKPADLDDWIGRLESGQLVAIHLDGSAKYGEVIQVLERL